MTAISSITSTLRDAMRLSERHSQASQQDVTIEREFPLDGQEVTVKATAVVSSEDDSDHNRETGYGAHTRIEVSEVTIYEVIDQDGVTVYNGHDIDLLSDDQYLDLEAQVAEYARHQDE